MVALRDAGAHFITTFGRTPDVATWLNDIVSRAATGESTEVGDDSLRVPESEPQTTASVSQAASMPEGDTSFAEASPESAADEPLATSPVATPDNNAGNSDVAGEAPPETLAASAGKEVKESP